MLNLDLPSHNNLNTLYVENDIWRTYKTGYTIWSNDQNPENPQTVPNPYMTASLILHNPTVNQKTTQNQNFWSRSIWVMSIGWVTATGCVGAVQSVGPGADVGAHMSRSSTLGSSTTDLILRRKVTASLPSTRRWSYVRATYIMGRISTCGVTTKIFNLHDKVNFWSRWIYNLKHYI